MSGEFEYAIRKDVRNNPIVREVDRERHLEMWRSVAVGVFLVAVLLFSAWQHFELLRHGYRIERLAMQRLGMVAPKADDATVIERVTSTPPPPKSVVARR